MKFYAYKPDDLAYISFRKLVLEGGHSFVFDAVIDIFVDFRVVEFLYLLARKIVWLNRFSFDRDPTARAIFLVTGGAV